MRFVCSKVLTHLVEFRVKTVPSVTVQLIIVLDAHFIVKTAHHSISMWVEYIVLPFVAHLLGQLCKVSNRLFNNTAFIG